MNPQQSGSIFASVDTMLTGNMKGDKEGELEDSSVKSLQNLIAK